MRHETPCSSKRLNSVWALLRSGNCLYGSLVVKPDDVAAWKNERLQNVWLGTSQCQWSATANSRARVLMTGTASGGKQLMMMLYSANVGGRPVRWVKLLT